MYTYFLVFEYTADRSSYSLNKIIRLKEPLCEDDVEIQEKLVTEQNKNRKVRLVFFSIIEPSRKPPKNVLFQKRLIEDQGG
jgi:hypothetical protein